MDREPSAVQVLDVVGRAEGGAWLAVETGDSIKTVQIQPGVATESRVLTLSEDEDTDVELQCAAGNLLAYTLRDQYGNGFESCVVESQHGRLSKWEGPAPIRLVPLSDEASIVLVHPRYLRTNLGSVSIVHRQFAPAEAYLYQTGMSDLVPLPEVDVSTEALVIESTQQRQEDLLRVASIVERDWEWAIELSTMALSLQDGSVVPRSKQTVRLPGEVTAWTRLHRFVVLAYVSGRIEIRPANRPTELAAIGYVSVPPDSMVAVDQAEGSFLVISAGDLLWFDVSDFSSDSGNCFDDRRPA